MDNRILLCMIMLTSLDLMASLPLMMDPVLMNEKINSYRKPNTTVFYDNDATPCSNLYESSCQKIPPKDPTGEMQPLSLLAQKRRYGELKKIVESLNEKILRLEDIKIPNSCEEQTVKLRALYCETCKIDESLTKVKKLFESIKDNIVDILLEIKDVGSSAIWSFQEAIPWVELKLDTDYLFEAMIESRDGDIYIGGEILKNIKSEHALHFILSHELAHIFNRWSDKHLREVKECIHSEYSNQKFNEEEIYADWFAIESLAYRLEKMDEDTETKKEIVKNIVRGFCGYPGSNDGHPTGRFRADLIASHPKINEILCNGENRPKEPKENALKFCKI